MKSIKIHEIPSSTKVIRYPYIEDKIYFKRKKNNYNADFILQDARGEDDVQTARDQLDFIKAYISKYFQ